MKKLLSLLTITTLTASVPAPLLANTTLERVKRDVAATAKDVTTGFDLKIKNELWHNISSQEKPFDAIDNKYYFVVWKGNNQWNINQFINDKFPNQILSYNGKDRIIVNYKAFTVGQRPKELYLINKNGLTIKNWSEDNGTYFKGVYRWDGVGEPQTPEIDSTGNIAYWIVNKTKFQQGILFALADGSKTASWSNAGMRLTVDGETNININNSNVEEVYWDGVKQNMLDHKVNINVKPETSEKTHKLVIKYDINGTKYTSEDIDVVIAGENRATKANCCWKFKWCY